MKPKKTEVMSTQEMPKVGQKIRVTMINGTPCRELVAVTAIYPHLLRFSFEPKILDDEGVLEHTFYLKNTTDQYETIN